ncbi:MAG: hypothetical protein OXI50_02950, partial [Gammaproteobacteria bacterium]|nr:hypothetical protein [Gammaproteobacteria bacterium]
MASVDIPFTGFAVRTATEFRVTASQLDDVAITGDLIPAGASDRYLTNLRFQDFSAVLGRPVVLVAMFFDTVAGGGTGGGDDLSAAAEGDGVFTVAVGDLSLDFAIDDRDINDPYNFSVDGDEATTLIAFIQAVAAATSPSGGTVTLRDGPAAPPVQSTQYAYIRAAAAPSLPAPQNQRSTAGAPGGWLGAATSATTTLAVYRISRTISTLGGVFQSASTDWAWDPATQPGSPWRNFALSTRTEYAYRRGASLPSLPTGTTEALPAGWSAGDPGATTAEGVYRIRRTVSSRAGAFVSATAWAWAPAAASQPWAPAATTRRTQHAYRAAETLAENALPASTAEALPAGWSAATAGRDTDNGVYRIARTLTERLGSFVSATAWAWDPAYASQPWQKPLSALSSTIRKFTTRVRHRATGATCTVVWTLLADLLDGKVGRNAISTTLETAIIVGASAADQNSEARMLAGTTPVGTLTDATASTVTRIEIGISADIDPPLRATAFRRDFLPQVQAGDVVSVFEDRDRNWADYLVTGVPASIAENARHVSIDVAHLENGGADINIAGACKIGFSRASRGATGREGEDGDDGRTFEYIFTAKADAAPITGTANLPLASQNYDVDALRTAAGLVRGTQAYFDGTPENLDDDRPYQIRFRRPVSGSPAENADIGSVAWTQEKAVRVVAPAGNPPPSVQLWTVVSERQAANTAVTAVEHWYADSYADMTATTRISVRAGNSYPSNCEVATVLVSWNPFAADSSGRPDSKFRYWCSYLVAGCTYDAANDRLDMTVQLHGSSHTEVGPITGQFALLGMTANPDAHIGPLGSITNKTSSLGGLRTRDFEAGGVNGTVSWTVEEGDGTVSLVNGKGRYTPVNPAEGTVGRTVLALRVDGEIVDSDSFAIFHDGFFLVE